MVQFDALLSAHRDSSSVELIGEVETRDIEQGILFSGSKCRLRLR